MLASDSILDSETLLKLTACKREGDCKRVLESQGIHVFHGREGIWTTIQLVNAAGMNKMGLLKEQTEPESYL